MSRMVDMGRAALERMRGVKVQPDRFSGLTEEELVGAFAVAWDTALLRGMVHLLRAQRDKALTALAMAQATGMSNEEMRGICGRLAAAIETEAELIRTVEEAQKRRR